MRKDKGVITVFLVLILTILMAFFFTLIDITRIKSARNQLVIASDAAVTSALTNYDSDLYENYGILSFEDKGGENSNISSIVKSIFRENITPSANNLFKIDVSDENISVKTDGNPFEGSDSNKIMQEQMIYSMKYKGTENLVRQVFEKIANMLGSQKAIEEAEDLKEADEDADSLNKKFEKVQKGKLQALNSLFILAKNNKYEVFDSREHIGNIKNISKKDLLDYYPGNDSIGKAIESLSEYNGDTTLPQIYSHGYTKMILEMYKSYLNNEANKIQEDSSTTEGESSGEESSEDKTEDSSESSKKKYNDAIYQIDSFILKLENAGFLKFNNYNGQYQTFLRSLNKSKIKDAIDQINSLLSEKNRKKYNDIVATYEKVMNDENSSMKDSAKEDYDYYTKNLSTESLTNTLNNLNIILALIEKIEGSNLGTNINTMINSGKNLVNSASGLSQNVINEMNSKIGLDFNAKDTSVDSFVSSICSSKVFKNYGKIKDLIKNVQIHTTNGMNKALGKEFNMKPPQENSVFERFYKVFKEMLKRVTGDAGKETLIGTLKKFNTGKKISGISLPNHTASSESSEDKLSEKLDAVTNLGGNISLDGLLKSGGELADKLYIIEYIMTNFKDLVEIKDIENLGYKRIPEETDNDTILDYEVEAIISSKYSDDDSKTSMLDEIILTRTVLNTVSFFNYQTQLKSFITTISSAVSAATAGVVPMPAVKYAIATVWIAIETRSDIIDIFNGYSVPLIKDQYDQWVNKLGFDASSLEEGKEALEGILEDKVNNIENLIEKRPEGEPYNKQDVAKTSKTYIGSIPLMYTDLLRLELLTKNKDTLIDNIQDVIVANMNTSSNGNFDYNKYKTNIEVGVNESNVNILFKTPTFSTQGAIQKFKEFSFKKSYN